ncbi:GTP cyclohydrolase II [Amycolatopsis sp. NPDC058340]|uniref:GTP cyclohydrolase II n=1 Tax=Amycolatopsis sp. NPDC058340 TaxID=3346453 RepID=UPI0036640F7E
MKRLWPWLRILGALVILGVLVRQLGTGAFVEGLREVDAGGIAAALGIGFATTVFSAWRWRLVARRLSLRLSLPSAVGEYYRALFLNGVLPAGVLGDVNRAVQHGREAGDVPRGVRAVVLERTAGQIVVIGASVVVVLTVPSVVPPPIDRVVTAAGIAVVVLALAAVVTGMTAGRRWIHSGSKWRRGFAVSLADVRLGLLTKETWPGVGLLSVATLAGHLALFVVAARAAGVTAPVGELLPLMILALLAMGLPLNIGGWGPREGVCALLFGAAGLGSAQGVTVAVVYGVLALVSSLPGAGVLLARSVKSHRTDRRSPMTVERVVETRLPTRYGVFRAYGYLDADGTEQMALVHGDVATSGTLARVHSECLTGDVFSSMHCECGDQLAAALRAIVDEGAGVLVYAQGHEGRGIGLLAKLKAMRLQDEGLDTVEANIALGLPVDARDYRAAAEILNDLGVRSVRLLSNNPAKVDQLERHGVRISERVPLLVTPNDENLRYLRTKQERMHHFLPHLDLIESAESGQGVPEALHQ